MSVGSSFCPLLNQELQIIELVGRESQKWGLFGISQCCQDPWVKGGQSLPGCDILGAQGSFLSCPSWGVTGQLRKCSSLYFTAEMQRGKTGIDAIPAKLVIKAAAAWKGSEDSLCVLWPGPSRETRKDSNSHKAVEQCGISEQCTNPGDTDNAFTPEALNAEAEGKGRSRIPFCGIILKERKAGTALKCHSHFSLQLGKKGNISATDQRTPKCTQSPAGFPADVGKELKLSTHFYEGQL